MGRHEEIEKELLLASYWEHFKFEKDLSKILPLNHTKRKAVLEEMNRIQKELNEKYPPTNL